MNRRRLLTISLLLLMVLASATAVVYAKYASRKHFVELEQLRSERDAVEVEWGRLQLEQGAWATHGRVERVARKRLQMRMPSSSEVLVVRP
jgi:cell division protein FtsL